MTIHRRNKIISGTLFFFLIAVHAPSALKAETGLSTGTGDGQNHSSQALAVLKQAMPPAPEGWIIAQAKETPSGYTITYRRTKGVRDEQKKLDQVYAESARRNNEAAKPGIDDLIRQQQRASILLKKATRRRNTSEQKRLNDELDENGRRMHALHEEMDREIARDVEPYLVRDAEASVSVTVNPESAELRNGQPQAVKGTTFAVRTEGVQAGTAWKEGALLLLYGEWLHVADGVFKAAVRQADPSNQGRTIRITITGEKKRCEQLLKQTDVKAILSLMER